MHYVYILRSKTDPNRFYIGATEDLRQRLEQHNKGGSIHTAKDRPWELIWYGAFKDTSSACRFEGYLKTASGRRLQKRHLWAKP